MVFQINRTKNLTSFCLPLSSPLPSPPPSPDVVLDNLVNTGQLEEEFREKVREALLQKHRHLNSKKEGDKKILEHIK